MTDGKITDCETPPTSNLYRLWLHPRNGFIGPKLLICGTTRQRARSFLVGIHTILVWIVRRGTGTMGSIIYLVGLIVVVMFILSLLGLH